MGISRTMIYILLIHCSNSDMFGRTYRSASPQILIMILLVIKLGGPIRQSNNPRLFVLFEVIVQCFQWVSLNYTVLY